MSGFHVVCVTAAIVCTVCVVAHLFILKWSQSCFNDAIDQIGRIRTRTDYENHGSE